MNISPIKIEEDVKSYFCLCSPCSFSLFRTHLLLLLPGPIFVRCRIGQKALTTASPSLTALYLLHLLNSYIAESLDSVVLPPPLLRSLGIWGFSTPPPATMPLLLNLLAVLAIAGLARSHTQQRVRAAPPQAHELRQLFSFRGERSRSLSRRDSGRTGDRSPVASQSTVGGRGGCAVAFRAHVAVRVFESL
jgi:hypothetical protein